MLHITLRKVFAALIFFGLTQLSYGQGPVGTMTGTVTDSANAIVPGATVVATNVATGVEATTTTTNTGAYTLPYLPAGSYKLRVSAAGFRAANVDHVLLRVAQTQNVDVKLEVGNVVETVTVQSGNLELQTTNAEIGTTVETKALLDFDRALHLIKAKLKPILKARKQKTESRKQKSERTK